MKNTTRGPHHQRDRNEEDHKWIHQPTLVSQRLRRKIPGKVTETDIVTLFNSFVYTFGGDLFWQKVGAPTGTRMSCPTSNL